MYVLGLASAAWLLGVLPDGRRMQLSSSDEYTAAAQLTASVLFVICPGGVG